MNSFLNRKALAGWSLRTVRTGAVWGKFWPDPDDCLLYHYGSKEEINTASQKASSCKMKNMIGRSEENRQGWEQAWLPGLRRNNDLRIRTWEQQPSVSLLLALAGSVSWANKRLLQVTSGGGQGRQMCWPRQAVLSACPEAHWKTASHSEQAFHSWQPCPTSKNASPFLSHAFSPALPRWILLYTVPGQISVASSLTLSYKKMCLILF